MNLRTVVLLAVALSVAGLTALLVNGWLAGQKVAVEAQAPAVAAPPPPPEILVTKKAMPAGTFVKPEELEWRPWPREGLTEAYLVKGKASEKDLSGAVVRTHLYAGEPITTSRVVHPGEQGFLAAVLDPGKRAVAIPIDWHLRCRRLRVPRRLRRHHPRNQADGDRRGGGRQRDPPVQRDAADRRARPSHRPELG